MVKFRNKRFTIPEGHYTGPKQDQIESAGQYAAKFGLSSAILGGIKGYLDGKGTTGGDHLKDIISGGLKGYAIGSLSGLAVKGVQEYVNKPISDLEFQQLDKNIRRQFGMYTVPGLSSLSIGDNPSNNAKLEDKISYNDKNITNYKVNFGIRRNQIVMYTFGMTDKELDDVSRILDRFTAQNINMDYNASLINKSQNAYAVSITFTTYNKAAEFIVEIAKLLDTKINLLDKDSYISGRVNEFNIDRLGGDKEVDSDNKIADDDSVKTFSLVGDTTRYNALEFLKECGSPLMESLRKARSIKGSISLGILAIIKAAIHRLIEMRKVEKGLPAERKAFNNNYLEKTLKDLHYVEGYHYSKGDEKATNNMCMIRGMFLVTSVKGTDSKKIDDMYYDSDRTNIKRAELDKVVTYTYYIDNRKDFEFLLKKLMSTKLTFNIFD